MRRDSMKISAGVLQSWSCLAAALLLLGWVWIVVLPWVGSRPGISRSIHEQQARGIDPSAMFYSDLELIGPIAHRLERLHDSDSAGLWQTAPGPRPSVHSAVRE